MGFGACLRLCHVVIEPRAVTADQAQEESPESYLTPVRCPRRVRLTTPNRLSDKTDSGKMEDMMFRSLEQRYGFNHPCITLPAWTEDAMGAEAGPG